MIPASRPTASRWKEPTKKRSCLDHGTRTLSELVMADKSKPSGITSVLKEKRLFPPPKEFSRRAHIKSLAEYRKLYNESIRSPEKFWARQAKEELVWFKPWKKVLQWKIPFSKWFVGGQLNVSVN